MKVTSKELPLSHVASIVSYYTPCTHACNVAGVLIVFNVLLVVPSHCDLIGCIKLIQILQHL